MLKRCLRYVKTCEGFVTCLFTVCDRSSEGLARDVASAHRRKAHQATRTCLNAAKHEHGVTTGLALSAGRKAVNKGLSKDCWAIVNGM